MWNVEICWWVCSGGVCGWKRGTKIREIPVPLPFAICHLPFAHVRRQDKYPRKLRTKWEPPQRFFLFFFSFFLKVSNWPFLTQLRMSKEKTWATENTVIGPKILGVRWEKIFGWKHILWKCLRILKRKKSNVHLYYKYC